MKLILPILSVLLSLAFILWLGLQIKPAPFQPFEPPAKPLKTIPLPSGLPAPVERFYRLTYGDSIPVITSTVLSGRGKMAPFGVDIPMRFRFLYDANQDYRARIEMTFFGMPFMKADETYIAGHAIGHMPTGTDEGPWFDDAMNVRVWCEVLNWFPAALLTDSRVRWDAVDDEMAILVVPFGAKQQRIIVRFDPQTGQMLAFEAMKYRTAGAKILWINGIWFDQGKPWLAMDIEEKVFNASTKAAIGSK